MKPYLKVLLAIAFVACLITSIGQAATEIWPITDATQQAYPYAQVLVTPAGSLLNTNGGYTLVNPLYKFNADGNGVSTMTNLSVGTYSACAMSGDFTTCISFSVTNFNSTNYITNNSTVVIQPGTSNAFSMAASDARYVQIGTTNTLPANLVPLAANNGVSLTNTVGFNLVSITYYTLDTNQVSIAGNTSYPSANATYIWNIGLGMYSNSANHIVLYQDLDAGTAFASNAVDGVIMDASISTGYQDYVAFPLQWNDDVGPLIRIFGAYGYTNKTIQAYIQSTSSYYPTISSNGNAGLYANFGSNNLIRLDFPQYPSGNVGGFNNTNFGLNSVIFGGGANYIDAIDAAIVGSSICTIIHDGGDSMMGACEASYVSTGAGVSASLGCVNMTNVGFTAIAQLGLWNAYIGSSSQYSVVGAGFGVWSSILDGASFGSSTNNGTSVFNYGDYNFTTNGTFIHQIGYNLKSTSKNHVIQVGAGLPDSASGTMQVGQTNSYITHSNTTATVTGLISFTGGFNSSATNTYTMASTGYTNAGTKNIMLNWSAGTITYYSNILSKFSKTSVGGNFLILKPSTCVVGTGFTGWGEDD